MNLDILSEALRTELDAAVIKASSDRFGNAYITVRLESVLYGMRRGRLNRLCDKTNRQDALFAMMAQDSFVLDETIAEWKKARSDAQKLSAEIQLITAALENQ